MSAWWYLAIAVQVVGFAIISSIAALRQANGGTMMLDRADTPEAEEQDGPTLYVGMALEIEQILLGYNVLTAKMRDFKGAVDFKQDVTVKLLADDLARVSSQISIMATHVSSVVSRHINRRPQIKE